MLSAYLIDPESVHLVEKTPLYALLDYKEKLEADIILWIHCPNPNLQKQ